MKRKLFLVQYIDSCCCERINIQDLYFGYSEGEAYEVYKREIDTFIKDTYGEFCDEETEQKMNLEIDETKTYWEYCNDDGDNVVILINEYELEIPVLLNA